MIRFRMPFFILSLADTFHFPTVPTTAAISLPPIIFLHHLFTCQLLNSDFVKDLERCVQLKGLTATLANKADLHCAGR